MNGLSIFQKAASVLLVVVGLLQSIGSFTQNNSLYLLGRATMASPHPDVFCAAQGLEPISNVYTVIGTFKDGTDRSVEVSRKISDRFASRFDYIPRLGPYLFGVIWFPVMNTQLSRHLLSYGLCHSGTLANELGFSEELLRVQVLVRSSKGLPIPMSSIQIECGS